MDLLILVILLIIWSIACLLFARDFKQMGGKIPLLMSPFSIQRMFDEYKVLCKNNNKKSYFPNIIVIIFILFCVYGVIFASISKGQFR